MGLKITVSLVRFRPWAPIKSKTYLEHSISKNLSGQHLGQQVADFELLELLKDQSR
jgi:hypothetical protein